MVGFTNKYTNKTDVLKDAPQRKVRLECLPEHLLNDIEVIIAVMKEWGEQYGELSAKMKANKEVTLTAVTRWGQALGDVSNKFKNDKDIVMASLKNNGMNLEYASKKMRDTQDVVLHAVKKNPASYRFVSERLKTNDEVIRATLYAQGMCLQLMSFEIRSNEDYFALAMHRNGAAYPYGEGDFVFKAEYIERALEHGGNLPYMPPYIRKDPTRVKKEVSSVGRMLEYVSPKLKNNKEIVLAALKADVHSFEFASKKMRSDPDVFLAACSLEKALKLTSKEIRSNPEILIKALNNGMLIDYLKYASDTVFQDTELLIKMFQDDLPRAIKLLPKEVLKRFDGIKPENYILFLQRIEFKEKLDLLPKKSKKDKKQPKI
jgi:Domain of unknown function (DUF4116)